MEEHAQFIKKFEWNGTVLKKRETMASNELQNTFRRKKESLGATKEGLQLLCIPCYQNFKNPYEDESDDPPPAAAAA
jgi:hypothetical protein